MKHLKALILCLAVSLLTITGCADSGTSTKEIVVKDSETSAEAETKNDATDAEEAAPDVEEIIEDVEEAITEAIDSKAPASDITIEEQVLFEQDGLKVTATEYVVDSIWGDGIKLLIENNGTSDVGLGCTALIVNDYMITDLFSSTVAAGKKDYDTLNLSSSSLQAAGIENVGKIEVYFHTFDPDSYMTITDIDCVTIKTSAYDSMDNTPNDAGQELYNDDGIRIVGKYVDEGSFWGTAVLLYIENNSGKNAIIQCDDMSVNGFMVTPFFSDTVYDGKKSISDITLLSSELEENNISSVDEIELKFKIIDEDYMNSKESDVISFSAK